MTQLPYLLRLLDDPTPLVRRALADQFRAYGPDLSTLLDQLPSPPDAATRRQVALVLDEQRQQALLARWTEWQNEGDEALRLEKAQALLSGYLGEANDARRLGPLLDRLADECRQRYPQPDVTDLAKFLFINENLRGARGNYFAPCNSNLVHVLEDRHGLPISLACIYILVGRRLGLDIRGCNYPGHFLARCQVRDQIYFVDCFDRGRFLTEHDLVSQSAPVLPALERILLNPASADEIVERVLRNLVQSFERAGEDERASFLRGLLAPVS